MATINVIVKTGAATTAITKEEGDTLYINLKERPEHNKANIALLKFLHKYYGKEVHILRGLTSKRKIITINDSKV